MNEKVDQYSPDRSYKLTFYDFDEPKMGLSICRFSLTDLQTSELIDFNPLWAIGIGERGFSWSEDSNFFSIHLVNPPKGNIINNNFFIYNIDKRRFSSVHFSVWNLIGHCSNDHIEIEYDEPIPGDNLMYPTKDLVIPANLKFDFAQLQWIGIDQLKQFYELNEEDSIIQKFEPIDEGWRPFKGQLPQNTDVLIWNLKRFAEFGDAQSKEWLAEINAKTDKIDYWVNASNYLGFKIRG